MKNHNYIPSYLKLNENLFQEKIEQGKSNLENCQVCPHHCSVNRLEDEHIERGVPKTLSQIDLKSFYKYTKMFLYNETSEKNFISCSALIY